MDERINYIRKGQRFDPRETQAVQAEYLKLGIDPELADSGLMSHITGSTRRRIKLRDNYIDTFRDTLVSKEALIDLDNFETIKQSPSIEEAQKAVQDMTIGVVPRLTSENIAVYHELPSSIQDYMKTSLTNWFDGNKDANGEQINNTFKRYANYAFHTDAAIVTENRSFNAEVERMERLFQDRLPDAMLTGDEDVLRKKLTDTIGTITQDHQTKIDHLLTLGTDSQENYRQVHRIYKTMDAGPEKEAFKELLLPLAGLPITQAVDVAKFIRDTGSKTSAEFLTSLKVNQQWDGNTTSLSPAQRHTLKEAYKYTQVYTPPSLPNLTAEVAAKTKGTWNSAMARIEEKDSETVERIREIESELNPQQLLLLKHSLVHHANAVADNNNNYSAGGEFFLGRQMAPSDILQIGIQSAFSSGPGREDDSLILIGEEEPVFMGFGGGETFTPLIDNIQNSQYGHQWLIDQVKKQNFRTMASSIPGVEFSEVDDEIVLAVEMMTANSPEEIQAIVNVSNEFVAEQRDMEHPPKNIQAFIQRTLELPHVKGKIEVDDETQQFIVSGEFSPEEAEVSIEEIPQEQISDEDKQEIEEAVAQAQGRPVETDTTTVEPETTTSNFDEVKNTPEWKSGDFMSQVEAINNWTDSTGENPFFIEDERQGIEYYAGIADKSPFVEDGDSVHIRLQSRQEDDTRVRRMKITFRDGTLHVEPVVSILAGTPSYQGITEPLTFDDIPESRVKDHVRWMALNLNLAQTSKTPRGIGSPTSRAANDILTKIDLEGPDMASFGIQSKRQLLEDALKDIMGDATGGERLLDFSSFRGFHRKS